jgi:hypothetical protein
MGKAEVEDGWRDRGSHGLTLYLRIQCSC